MQTLTKNSHGLAVSLALALVLLILPTAVATANAPSSSFPAARASIQGDDLTRHGALLSSDELEGREGASRGEAIAALYIASEFRRLGLLPGGEDGTYFQPFTIRDGDTYNVLGLLPGTDPDLRDEYLIVGGHYDHIGLNRRGDICNGADDNASGTAAVLELAEAFRLLGSRRSVVFIGFAFAAEEKGLLGSKHYCANPVYPLDRTVAMVNLDMIGRSKDDYLFIGGAGTSPLFRPLIDRTNQDFRFNLEIKDAGGAPSDNMPFFLKGVPVLFLFTGVHADYNQPTDDWHRINLDGLEKIARFAFTLAAEIADRDERPEFVRESGFALPDAMMRSRRTGRTPRLGIRLGDPGDGPGVVVGDVTPGSAAAAAGLMAGDRIVSFGSTTVGEASDLLTAIRGVKFGDEVEIVVQRAGETRRVLATFRAPPGQ